MKVYLVSKGEYSDWQIVGVFSTLEKAEAFLVAAKGANPDKQKWDHSKYNDVEEWEVDEIEDPVVKPVWKAFYCLADIPSMNLSRGEVRACSEPERLLVGGKFRGNVTRDNTYATAKSAISREHAVKLAVEDYQAWLREQAITGPSPSAS